MNEPRRVSQDETVVEMLRADPDFANEYLAAALEEAELPCCPSLKPALRRNRRAAGEPIAT